MTLDTTRRSVPPTSLWARLVAVLRGLCAAAGLLAGAGAALAGAVVGTPPGALRHLGHLIADEYRRGFHGATDADVIDDEQDEQEDER